MICSGCTLWVRALRTESVKKLFRATKDATDAGVNTIRAGVKAYLVDKASRDSVIASGYPEYLHGTGHAIARVYSTRSARA